MENASVKNNQENHQDLIKEIQTLTDRNHLNMCLECGKCSAVCPMVAFYGGDFVYKRSSRAIAERLCFDPSGIYDEAIWYCLACQECTFFCPSGVDFQDFMIELRALLISKGHKEYAHFCSECGEYMMPKRQLDTLKKNLKEGSKDLLYECPHCKRHKQAEALRRMSPKGRQVSGSISRNAGPNILKMIKAEDRVAV